ncbi:hypothetical protein [Pontibacter sp. SGAir0037]|uniref:hypothetical protein n=1 Tax=Pontibacter sp. SGAir0037 TaxID=2571030 RepID=UPI0010CCEC70|nr:hypothetical protein [Pontibacter sp. SGAir0037]QCR22999.1 hypothetical protein C1N53_12025 [Pontibacter sp. SGAir0037]
MLENTANLYRKILHIRLTDTFASLPRHTLEQVSPNNPFKRLLIVLLYTGGRLIFNLFKVNKPIDHLQQKVWLYVVSQNNVESLQFIKEAMPEAEFVAGQNKRIGRYAKTVNRIPYRWKILSYYKYPYVLWKLYQIHGKKVLRFFDLVYDAIGYYEVYLRTLRKHRPTAIIFANDHNPDARAMLYAAKHYKIPTVYIQHASVSNSFPPLEHDLSLLEGQAALDTYQQCGPVEGEVKFIGMPKADHYLKKRKSSNKVQRVGICCNTIDTLEGIVQLVTQLSLHLPDLILSIRPHPRDNRDFNLIRGISPKATLSNPASEGPFMFLEQQDVIIAGDSSILLEATLLNIPSIYYKFDEGALLDDYYGYVKNGVVERADTTEKLISIIENYIVNRPVVYQHAKYYNATVGTRHEAASAKLALDNIKDFLNNG